MNHEYAAAQRDRFAAAVETVRRRFGTGIVAHAACTAAAILLAAIAGLLAAGRQDAVNNSMGKDMVLFTFAGAILGGCSLDGGKGTALGMLGGALLLGTITNALTLMGINVFILYATYGFLIFVAVLLDRLRVKLRERIFFKENLRRLAAAKPD